jgi:hypothetical protein
MQCRVCNRELAEDSKLCTTCSSVSAASNLEPSVALSSSNTLTDPNPVAPLVRPFLVLGVFFRILLAIAWGGYVTLFQYRFQPSSEACGYWLGTLLIPFLLAYVIAGREKRRNVRAFAWWFLGILVLLSLSSVLTSHNRLSDLSFADAVKTLRGASPLASDAPEDDKRTVAVSKLIFSDLNTLSASYQQSQTQLAPDLAKLYTYASFSTRESIQQALSVISRKHTLDQDLEAKIEHFPDEARQRLDASGMSESEKQQYLKGFTESFNGSEIMTQRRIAAVAETAWTDSASDLYNFTFTHHFQIAVATSSITIPNPEIRTQFNTKLNLSKKLRADYFAAATKVTETRAAVMKSKGLTPNDLGLKK